MEPVIEDPVRQGNIRRMCHKWGVYLGRTPEAHWWAVDGTVWCIQEHCAYQWGDHHEFYAAVRRREIPEFVQVGQGAGLMYRCGTCGHTFARPGWDCDGEYCPKCHSGEITEIDVEEEPTDKELTHVEGNADRSADVRSQHNRPKQGI